MSDQHFRPLTATQGLLPRQPGQTPPAAHDALEARLASLQAVCQLVSDLCAGRDSVPVFAPDLMRVFAYVADEIEKTSVELFGRVEEPAA